MYDIAVADGRQVDSPRHVQESEHNKASPGDVTNRVSAPTKHEHGYTEALHVLNSLRVSLKREVEASQTVARQRISATL